MLHILYLIAFTILAFLAIGNLIRNLVQFSVDAQRSYVPTNTMSENRPTPHPELLDDTGHLTSEPLLVMKSITVDDARARLDALYNDLPSYSPDSEDSSS